MVCMHSRNRKVGVITFADHIKSKNVMVRRMDALIALGLIHVCTF